MCIILWFQCRWLLEWWLKLGHTPPSLVVCFYEPDICLPREVLDLHFRRDFKSVLFDRLRVKMELMAGRQVWYGIKSTWGPGVREMSGGRHLAGRSISLPPVLNPTSSARMASLVPPENQIRSTIDSNVNLLKPRLKKMAVVWYRNSFRRIFVIECRRQTWWEIRSDIEFRW